MAAKTTKRLIEVLLVRGEMTGLPERGLLKSRNLGSVDLTSVSPTERAPSPSWSSCRASIDTLRSLPRATFRRCSMWTSFTIIVAR